MPPGAERQASPDQEVAFALASPLRGVPVGAAELAAAAAIVRADVLARRAPIQSGEDGWERALRSMAERDASLRALLNTDAQWAAFDAKASGRRQLLEDVRQRATRCDLGESPPAALPPPCRT
jgi:hypothetical protein